MNYTKPQDLNYHDKPEDWLGSALIFAAALGKILKLNEGVVIDIVGDMNIGNIDCKKVVVYNKEKQVHIIECEENIPNGELVWVD